ncbi:MAG: dienelactone hydrolase family protein [Chloroflexi bacterium]|nr:dienelactone hydrolase family protein [Chloroflexota bacterium]
MRETPVSIVSQKAVLEGLLCVPDTSAPVPGVVICHPNPLYGGCMDNPVVVAMCQALAEQSLASLRFNFRGVGNSQGCYGRGLTEQEDALAALSLLAAHPGVDPDGVGLAGYSFGARIAISIAPRDSRVRALALVSPPISAISPTLLDEWHRPKFLISGSRDDFILPDEFRHFFQDLSEPKSYKVIEGADHFWWGKELEVAQHLASFLAQCLRRARRL